MPGRHRAGGSGTAVVSPSAAASGCQEASAEGKRNMPSTVTAKARLGAGSYRSHAKGASCLIYSTGVIGGLQGPPPPLPNLCCLLFHPCPYQQNPGSSRDASTPPATGNAPAISSTFPRAVPTCCCASPAGGKAQLDARRCSCTPKPQSFPDTAPSPASRVLLP